MTKKRLKVRFYVKVMQVYKMGCGVNGDLF